jgi:hypothetical protein
VSPASSCTVSLLVPDARARVLFISGTIGPDSMGGRCGVGAVYIEWITCSWFEFQVKCILPNPTSTSLQHISWEWRVRRDRLVTKLV